MQIIACQGNHNCTIYILLNLCQHCLYSVLLSLGSCIVIWYYISILHQIFNIWILIFCFFSVNIFDGFWRKLEFYSGWMVSKRSVGFDPVDPLEKVSSDGWMIRSEGEIVSVFGYTFHVHWKLVMNCWNTFSILQLSNTYWIIH